VTDTAEHRGRTITANTGISIALLAICVPALLGGSYAMGRQSLQIESQEKRLEKAETTVEAFRLEIKDLTAAIISLQGAVQNSVGKH